WPAITPRARSRARSPGPARPWRDGGGRARSCSSSRRATADCPSRGGRCARRWTGPPSPAPGRPKGAPAARAPRPSAVRTPARGARRLPHAELRHVDLARLLHQPSLGSRIDGMLRAELNGPARSGNWNTASGDVSLALAPSTLRGRPVTGGGARLTLARGD